jgi:hypothetical protein
MVQINLNYTEEELTSKSSIFYCGAGWRQCMITNSEIDESRYATADKPRPKVLKVHYIITTGEYEGQENDIEFDLFDDSIVQFNKGGSAPRSQLAGKQFRTLSLACGFDATVKDSAHLHTKKLMINHYEEEKKQVEETDEYGQTKQKFDESGNPEYYPQRSDVVRKGEKFKKIPQVADHVQPAQAQAPIQPQPVQPLAPAPAVVQQPVQQVQQPVYPQQIAQPIQQPIQPVQPVFQQPQQQPAQFVVDDSIPF